MNIKEKLWDSGFGNSRTPEEWKELFSYLRDSLAEYLQCPVHVQHFGIDDDVDAKHSCVGASITVPVLEPIDLIFVGDLTLLVNHDQSVRAYAMLLTFCCGKRMAEHRLASTMPSETLVLELKPTSTSIGEWSHRLGLDEVGEWEEYMTVEDWSRED